MSHPPRYYGEKHLHFLTTSSYSRTPVFNSELFKREFISRDRRYYKASICASGGYMHNNPMVRKLVGQPGDWPWSSWRYYFLEDSSMIPMDRLP
ncbi:MAG TPA: hypothetical protein VFQ24_07845 [Terriglobia bacterium]|nr:hypothetical protein [Terriglobia bacterium]